MFVGKETQFEKWKNVNSIFVGVLKIYDVQRKRPEEGGEFIDEEEQQVDDVQ